MGYVKQIPRCLTERINVTNCTRILRSRNDRRTHHHHRHHHHHHHHHHPKPSGIESRELAEEGATSQSECFTVKRITRKLICCLSWSSREDLSADLCQKFQTSTTRAVCSNEYYRTEGHYYYL